MRKSHKPFIGFLYATLSSPLLRMIAIIFCIVYAMTASAQGWDGVSYEVPPGDGTSANSPYVITKPEHLEWMRRQASTFQDKYFRQDANISLNGQEWKVLNAQTANGDTFGFKGKYNGNGFTISDYVVYWDNFNTTIGFGLFCYINEGGVVENLNICNAHITRHPLDTPGVTFADDNVQVDPKLGILVAAIGPKAIIRNVNVYNSRIDDGGSNPDGTAISKPAVVQTIFVGGVIGDIASSFGGYSTVGAANVPTVKNVSANVDFDFTHTTRFHNAAAQYTQFNIGGIVGRLRRINAAGLPTSTIYSGSVKAPLATVGPVWGMARHAGDQTKIREITISYIGESSSGVAAYTSPESANQSFYNYRIWDATADTPDWKQITATYPAGGEGWLNGTRTFKANDINDLLTSLPGINTYTEALNSPAVWAMYQGVNRGSSLDADDADQLQANIEAKLAAFNSAGISEGLAWSYDPVGGHPLITSTQQYAFQGEQTSTRRFDVSISKHPETDNQADYRYRWSAILKRHDGTFTTPIEIFYDPNTLVGTSTSFTFDTDTYSTLKAANDGHDFSYTADLTLQVELLKHDSLTDTDTPVLTSDSQPLAIEIKPKLPTVSISNPTHHLRQEEIDGTEMNTESFCFKPTLKFGASTVAPDNELYYNWEVQNHEGQWVPFDAYYNTPGEMIGYTYPATYERQVRLNITYPGTSIAFPSATFTLRPINVSLDSDLPYTYDERQYTVRALNPYSGEEYFFGNTIVWQTDIPGTSFADNTKTVHIFNSDLPDDLKKYTVAITYTYPSTDPNGTHPVEFSDTYMRLRLYVSADESDPANPEYTGALVLQHSDLDGNPIQFTGSANGTWHWYEVDNSTVPPTYTEVFTGTPTGIVITNAADGLTSTLTGFDQTKQYRAEWVSDASSYADATGAAVTLADDYTPLTVLYVYAPNDYPDGFYEVITDFDGLDPDGVPYPAGSDANDGRSPWTALETLKEAYKRLQPTKDLNRNVIVLMGAVGKFDDFTLNSTWLNKSAHITGIWQEVDRNGNPVSNNMVDYHGTLTLRTGYYKDAEATAVTSNDIFRLHAPTRFSNMSIYSLKEEDTNALGGIIYFYGYQNDFIFDRGITLKNFPLISATSQGLDASVKLPAFTYIVGLRNNNIKDPGISYMPYNTNPLVATTIIRSSGIARLIGCSRNDGTTTQPNTMNIAGSPDKPMRSRITIDISNADDFEHNAYYVEKGYSHDMGIITGGQTDGTVWADVEVTFNRGKVSRYTAGSITYGRITSDSTPDDTFFGRTVLNLYGGEIYELYGGSLGRSNSNGTHISENNDPYFYGTSIINIYDGTINNNIYGAGAGGVTGIGDLPNGVGFIGHSPDPCIPYLDARGEVVYGDWATATAHTIPSVKMMGNQPPIDLLNSHVEVNIYGGTINGNVYGGGFGYSKSINVERAPSALDSEDNRIGVSGNLYGTSAVTVNGGTIHGSVYGGGAGSTQYITEQIDYNKKHPTAKINVDFTRLGQVHGNTSVTINGGTIGVLGDGTAPVDNHGKGNVFGGSEGIAGYPNMGTVYGNCITEIDGATIVGDIFGGGNFASVRHPGEDHTGMDCGQVALTINGGVIGNNIYGGSRGSDGSDNVAETDSYIDGNITLTVNGGEFLGTAYTNQFDSSDGFRDFNIYGGGYLNCTVAGDAIVRVYKSLMAHTESFMKEGENPNEWPNSVSNFQRAYFDITYRRFSIYGGGHGEKTRVLNTDVLVSIPTIGTTKPHGYTLVNFLQGQSFFDIAGGGYSGNIGYWADNGLPETDPAYDAFDHYVGGTCKVTIDGYTYARKVFGGGFYGSCNRTDTKVLCGSLRQIYGGSLLGYVHHQAKLSIGNNLESNTEGYLGPWSEDQIAPEKWEEAAAKCKSKNDYIYVTENIYAGNDVKGIIGTTRWLDSQGNTAIENTDNDPLFMADINPSEEKGIIFNIYGGTFMGDIYCAGNGYYRGYYVPEWVRYTDGPARAYRKVHSSINPGQMGKVYRSRPMVGSVNVQIRGNSATDFISIHGNFYGGGRACTIGQWNTFLPIEDPRRLIKGGSLRVNFGGFTHVKGNVYMGADGRVFKDQYTLPEDMDLSSFNGSTTAQLLRLGEGAYGHWWYNSERHRYEPGFPPPGKVDGNLGLTGEHMLRSFLQNIEMAGDVELTFYRQLYEVGNDGHYLNVNGHNVRRHWVPAELAIQAYDATDIKFGNFFLGGHCGSMTNNTVMYYNYTSGEPIIEANDPNYHNPSGPITGSDEQEDRERFGSIYRISLPRGLTIINAAVMGSQDARKEIFPYASDFHSLVKTAPGTSDPIQPYYDFDGGLVTKSMFQFDLIAYNDYMKGHDTTGIVKNSLDLPDDFYSNTQWEFIRNATSYAMLTDPGVTIHRFNYLEREQIVNYTLGEQSLDQLRYSMAVTYDNDNNPSAYIGQREDRATTTAVKLGSLCNFAIDEDLEVNGGGEGEGATGPIDAPGGGYLPDPSDPSTAPGGNIGGDPTTPESIDHTTKSGGIIFGGCYNSGVTMGDVVMHVASDMLCSHLNHDNEENFTSLASLRYNIGRIYGGGYGYNTEIRGNTYVNLLMGVRAMNVFGGGLGGSVTGTTSVNYIGNESSYIYGSIFGGGMAGNVGTGYRVFQTDGTGAQVLDSEGNPILIDCVNPGNNTKAIGTKVGLYSGNVSNVYGGSCMADVFGSTDVVARDEVVAEMDHLDFPRVLSAGTQYLDMAKSRLIIGSLYGGNDISGHVYSFGDNIFSTNILIHENPDADLKTTPGSDDLGYNGFPLVGTVYAGSNGNYGPKNNGIYEPGSKVWLYRGDDIETAEVDLTGRIVPNVDRANITINGGTIVDLYGGGNDATITQKSVVSVNYDSHDARAGFDNTNDSDDPKRIWDVLTLSSQEQFNEVLSHDNDQEFVFRYQIYNLYSGNNNADMSIQPQINLGHGHLGSVYGGGNKGRMTHLATDPATGKRKGIELTVNDPMVHIHALYGGGRVGDIYPTDASGNLVDFDEEEYGTTLNVHAGLIEAVYGGNDVSGHVHNGTNVNIYGAISGDVYCAGNGNYLYQYDKTLETDSNIILEDYNDEDYGGRYFRLAPKSQYGGTDASAEQRILAINTYRPNVDKAYLNIQGSSNSGVTGGGNQAGAGRVWVKGNVYCGGNSSTIHTETPNQDSKIKLNIGDHVVLNGVFLGSNGELMADTSEDGMLQRFEKVNNLLLTDENHLIESQVPASDAIAANTDYYPWLLSLYMRGVEVDGVPDQFNFNITEDDSFVGDICLGGNHGSMMTDKTLKVTIPETLTVYGNIVGGCFNTAFTYRNRLHSGGMTRFVDVDGTDGEFGEGDVGTIDPTTDEQNKVWITVKNKFAPLRLKYPVDGDIFDIALEEDIVTGENGLPVYGKNRCNVYGGCYESGMTIGDIRIDLQSNMLTNYNREVMLNSLDQGIRTFDIFGAGYGKMSMLIGDTKVRMLPIPRENASDPVVHPACSAIFGGSHQGNMVGNTFVTVRDGMVVANLYGASESAILYGSTNIVIGYPQIYRCHVQGEYLLDRTDKVSRAVTEDLRDSNGNPVIKDHIFYNPGDLVPANVYEMITERVGAPASESKESWFRTPRTLMPEDFDVNWDDIEIKIGDNRMYDLTDTSYRGHGNVYGGGFVSNNSDITLAGQPTVWKFNQYACNISHTPHRLGYGGNTSIMISDNPKNGDPTFSGAANEALRDHISIGTAHFSKVTMAAGENKIGKYYYNASEPVPEKRFIHQEAGEVTAEDVAAGRNVLYELEADGGIYGGGRKVFVQGFCACDLTGYGYADFTPQYPKLLNTLQRIDAMRVKDCCLKLVGAHDYASPTIDASLYAMAHIGQLNMYSSLDKDATLDTGYDVTATMNPDDINPYVHKVGYMLHNTPRTRNYLAFFNNARFIGAIQSNTEFDESYHDFSGAKVSGETYRAHKALMVQDRLEDNVVTHPTRNVGTAHNMIGINNGYTLKIQGLYSKPGDLGSDISDDVYYGPIIGVVEVKLLTMLSNEGGGYIYAFNKHVDGGTGGTSRAIADDHFVETTGNFVYPGRAFVASGTPQYILDDCYPDSYDTLTSNNTNLSGLDPQDPKIHYWYVSGNNYYFNTTLTAYTYNKPDGLPKDFYLDNYDNLITLSGVEPGSTIKVKSVTYNSHIDQPVTLSDGTSVPYDCDIRNYGRTDVTDPETGVKTEAYKLYLSVDKYFDKNHTDSDTPEIVEGAYTARLPRSNYSDTGSAVTADGVEPNAASNGTYGIKPSGTNSPLVGIRLSDAIDNSDPDYYRQHLSRPNNVTIVLEAEKPDENNVPIITTYTINLTISYLQGPKITGHINIDNCALPGEMIFANTGDMVVNLSEILTIKNRQWILKTPNEETVIDVSNYANINDYTKLELPVWWYQNGWDLNYRLTINGEPFDVAPDPTAEHNKVEVHNYHRMKAMYGSSEIYQILTPGSRIYIEDDADMERFLTLADSLSAPGYAPRVLPGTTLVDRPANCEGLRFFLRNNFSLAATRVIPAVFAGELNGDGYTITVPDNNSFAGELAPAGAIYNTGFLGKAPMFNTVSGSLSNCYYYSSQGQGGFCTNIATDAQLHNCYQNVAPTAHGNYATNSDFNYGRVAYNLNELYLRNRHSLLTTGERWVGEYLQSYYADGQYRYADWDQRFGLGTPDALRTAARPNYMNYSNSGRTHHVMNAPQDVDRYTEAVLDPNDGSVVTPAFYHPYYDSDYLKFGQTLSRYNSEASPSHFTEATRVWRASGFYGSKVDQGFHFNANAVALDPQLTAIDFTGLRDRSIDPTEDWTTDALRRMFYVPAMDMPATGLSSWAMRSNATIDDTDFITKNLLLYSSSEMAADLFSDVQYNETTEEKDINAHLVCETNTDEYSANAGLLHLVDKQDFNAPIEFNVGKRAWYERAPAYFATGDNGWEGVCLPFSANRVSAIDMSEPESNRSHGEITHFYGEKAEGEEDPNTFEARHEYWLRSLVGYSDTKGLLFARPCMNTYKYKYVGGAEVPQLTAAYNYRNEWFKLTYGDEYIDDHNIYTPEPLSMAAYTFLTHDLPYIVAFPSDRHYEFDLSGEFYKRVIGESNLFPMTICFEYLVGANRNVDNWRETSSVGSAATANLTIGVSDDAVRAVAADGYTLTGTYMHTPMTSAASGVIDSQGATFVQPTGGQIVLPFRTYMSAPGAMSAPRRISAPATDIITPDPDDVDPDGDNADATESMLFSVEDNVLVIRSPQAADVPLCDLQGRFLGYLKVQPGINSYPEIIPGYYIASKYKFRIN